MKTKDRVILIIIIAIMCTASLLAGAFINKSWGAEPFDCSKHLGKVWAGEIKNPSDFPVKVQIYNNEKVNDTDLMGIDKPYFEAVLGPGESSKLEYQCGSNSIIMRYENAFKSFDVFIPTDIMPKADDISEKTNI